MCAWGAGEGQVFLFTCNGPALSPSLHHPTQQPCVGLTHSRASVKQNLSSAPGDQLAHAGGGNPESRASINHANLTSQTAVTKCTSSSTRSRGPADCTQGNELPPDRRRAAGTGEGGFKASAALQKTPLRVRGIHGLRGHPFPVVGHSHVCGCRFHHTLPLSHRGPPCGPP